MEKLQLKHLAGYLPYSLNVKYRYLEQVSREEWKEFERDNILNGGFLTGNLDNLTPILRPLSYLTKEIEVNGEKFVPILELYKMRTQHMTDNIDSYYIENDTAILKLEEITTPDGSISFIHFFEIDIEPNGIHFSICTETMDNVLDEIIKESFGFIGNEFNMLQKLYEWHFDIHGGIGKWAIDINTLNK